MKKISVCIPYKQRIENIEIVFDALSNQTMDTAEFEVIVGAMEYSEEYIKLCQKYTDTIDITSVVSARDFSIPSARNLAMRSATGEVIVQMDADTLLPIDALENLYNHHFSFGQKICVVGQVVGYGNNNDASVKEVDFKSYSFYDSALNDLKASKGDPQDPRFQVSHAIPWAFGWTGLIAIPLQTLKEHSLYFDETFHGWGVDDLEWSYRVCKNKIPIVLCEDVQAIHLPHSRDAEANRKTEKRNYERFIKKWSTKDVELAYVFGDVQANSMYVDLVAECQKVADGNQLGIVAARVGGKDLLFVGSLLDAKGNVIDEEILKVAGVSINQILPLVGMATPFKDKSFHECKLLKRIANISKHYKEAIYKETKRISEKLSE